MVELVLSSPGPTAPPSSVPATSRFTRLRRSWTPRHDGWKSAAARYARGSAYGSSRTW
jgi:hypothetical protein